MTGTLKATNRKTRTRHNVTPEGTQRVSDLGTTQSAELANRIDRLFAAKIEFIDCDAFHRRSAGKRILEEDSETQLASAPRMPRVPKGLTPFLASLYATPLLSPAEEAALFRRMNYLKYRAHKRLWKLRPETATNESVEEIERDLSHAAEIKNQIIQANLRLVVSIAKKFLDGNETLHELVSDGIISLMRAVEKFDFSRGYKFSTYATYAIRRNYFRSVIHARKVRKRYVSGEDELLELSARPKNFGGLREEQIEPLQIEVSSALQVLNDRERAIIAMRFGIDTLDRPMTLQEIANAQGVCKERIRQIQSRAMEKLHRVVANRPELREIVG